MSKLNILLVSKSTGGLLTYMRWLAKGLDLTRFQLTFACLSEGGPELASELIQPPNIDALSWPMSRFRINPLTDIAVILRLFHLIRKEKFDLVHAHGSKAGFIARVAAIGSGIPVAYSPHGFAFDAGDVSAGLARLYIFVEKLAAKFFTSRIITVSNAERKSAVGRGVGTAELFATVHSGIELQQFDVVTDRKTTRASLGIAEDAPLVGTVGRLNAQKAPFDFIRLAALIHQTLPRIHFVWIGDGDLLNPAKELAQSLGVSQVIHFAGLRSDIPGLLHSLDCFLLTSHWEAFPIVLLEAMAARLPIVTTNLPGVDESVTDGLNGYLCPVGGLEAMRDSIEKIISDPKLAKRLAANGRKRLEAEFTREIMLKKLEDVYAQLCATKLRYARHG